MPQLALNYPSHLQTVKATFDQAMQAASVDGVAIYSGHARLQFLDDMHYPFRANPHLKWWLPDSGNEYCWIYYAPGTKPKLVFYQPDDYWYLPPSDPSGFWVEHFDICIVRQSEQARGELPGDLSRTAVLGEPELLPDWGFGAINPDTLINPLHWRRGRKTAYELECMTVATQRGVAAHRAAEAAFRDGASEYEIQQAYLLGAGQTDDEMPYGNIVGLNEHGAVLHYQHLDKTPPAQLHSFLIDAGASCAGYACDITRSYSANPGDKFDQMIQALDQHQQEMCAGVQVGTPYPDLHLDAHRRVAGILSDFDLVSVSPEEAVASGVTSTFYPHGLGHLLGLQVHDVGGHQAGPEGGIAPPPKEHPFLRMTQTLDAGHVVTIEPGIYFIPSLLDKLRSGANAAAVNWDEVNEMLPCGGVRIEDNVVATPEGPRNLTREAFAAA